MANLEITDADIDALQRDVPGLAFDAERRVAMRLHSDIQACPGSGKTTLIAAKLILLAQKWTPKGEGVCVLSHTNVAKEEIIRKLVRHSDGIKLLSYPHFIGTIQEFVNKFLALPLSRAKYGFSYFAEDDEATKEIYEIEAAGFDLNALCRSLYRRCGRALKADLIKYLSTLHYINGNFDLGFYGPHNSLISFSAENASPTYEALLLLKEKMLTLGVYQYRDMYAFATRLLEENVAIKNAIRARFPFVIIDEMQDTQKFQDELLNSIFKHESVTMQRLGDPDQAIFGGVGGGEPNETYNSRADLTPIQTSHRYGRDIVNKIRGLSYNKLPNMSSIRIPNDGDKRHTIFLYSDLRIHEVLEAFSTVVAANFPNHDHLIVKAVGAVGKPSDTATTIKNYWPLYDKDLSEKSLKPKSMLAVIKKAGERKNGNFKEDYDLLTRNVVFLLNMDGQRTRNADQNEVHYNLELLRLRLKEEERYDDWRQLVAELLLSPYPTREVWEAQVGRLSDILSLRGSAKVRDFLAYVADPVDAPAPAHAVTNKFVAQNNLIIDVSTIHGVKGETHDATLVLETSYNRQFDIRNLIPQMIDPAIALPPVPETNHKLIKQLYVAMSRPQHLLCLAAHEDHVDAPQREALATMGWEFALIN